MVKMVKVTAMLATFAMFLSEFPNQGEDGVVDVINILKGELELAMQLSGCERIADINSDLVMHETHYSKL